MINPLTETTKISKEQLINLNETLKKEIDQLKKENEELKITNQSYKLHWEVYLKNTEQNLKYKQALTEIKEIAELCRASLYGYDQEKYPKQILQKISEVIDE